MASELLQRASRNLTRAKVSGAPAAIAPSALWKQVLEANHLPLIRRAQDARTVIDIISSRRGFFTMPCVRNDPFFETVLSEALAWHDAVNRPLRDLPASVCESEFASAEVRFQVEGRELSTAFLWFLRCALRIVDRVSELDVMLEIGSGFGGLARTLHLVKPDTRCVLVDMPACLWFAEVYLGATLPDAKIHYLQPNERVVDLAADVSFVLVPANRLEACKGLKVDCVVNTQSLSAMTDAAACYFINWIQTELDARYFYSVNRFGHHEDGLHIAFRADAYCGSDVTPNAFAYDPHWEVVLWAFTHAENNVGLADPRFPRTLELLTKRIPPADRDAAAYERVARQLEAEARFRLRADSRFFRAMWITNTKAPTARSVRLMADVLRQKGWRQANYYAAQYERLSGVKVPRLEERMPTPDSVLYFTQEPLRRHEAARPSPLPPRGSHGGGSRSG